MKRWITAGLAGIMAFGMVLMANAAEPWTKVNGKFIGSDGKEIEGAKEKGVTITEYQNRAGEISWKKLKMQNISFAMIRLGYMDDKDPYFDVNIKNAVAHGIKPGVVFFSKALTSRQAREEASYVLDQIKDYDVAYPIAYDVESQYILSKGRTKKQITDQVNAFCKVIEDAGYRSAVYGGFEWLTKNMDTEKIPYDIWYARYGVANKFPNRTIWQCTDSGKVDGIKGNVCLEFSFVDYEELFPGTGWRFINGIWYYYVNYKLVRSSTLSIDGKNYNFGPNGACINRVEKPKANQ